MLFAAVRSASAFSIRSLHHVSAPQQTSSLLRHFSTTAAADSETLINNRISRAPVPSSLDARTLSDNLDLVLSHLRSRRASDEAMDAAKTISTLNLDRVALIKKRDEALQQRNELSAKVGMLMRESKGEETEEIIGIKAEATTVGETAAGVEESLAEIESKMNTLLASLPNLLDDVVPDGDDDSQNELVSEWGDVSTLPKELGWDDNFEPLWHDDVATNLGGWQSDVISNLLNR